MIAPETKRVRTYTPDSGQRCAVCGGECRRGYVISERRHVCIECYLEPLRDEHDRGEIMLGHVLLWTIIAVIVLGVWIVVVA